MKENNVFAADSDSLAGDIAIYGALFSDFLQAHAQTRGQTNPEITAPILAAYNVGPNPCIMSAMINAFVAGVNAGIALCLHPEKEFSNSTNIE